MRWSDGSRRRDLKTARAKQLRAEMTDAERKLWHLPRNRQLGSAKFRRQQPIGPYIADFFCAAAKLIVEMDGGHHTEMENQYYDEDRTRFLNERGCRVLRFNNQDVLKRPHDIADVIRHAVETGGRTPPRTAVGGSTLPQGEGEKS